VSSEFRRINTEEPFVSIETVGETHTTWIVDAEKEEVPTPRMFRDLGTAGTKLVVLSTMLPETYQAEAERIYERVVRLKRMMARERLDDEQSIGHLCLGSLDELPEVEAEREFQSSADEQDGEEIEITGQQRERLDRIRAECTCDGDLPEPTDQMMLGSLMDTWDAVNDGYYSGGETP
jgi:hypothetical protein